MVVKAQKIAVNVRLAEAQLSYYVTEIEEHLSFRDFGFLDKGLEIHFVNVGHAAKGEVLGFFTRVNLDNLLYLRQSTKPPSLVEINAKIVTRSYQDKAIRRTEKTLPMASAKF